MLTRAILTQPVRWSADGIENFDAVLATAERSDMSFGPTDVFLIPELVGSDLDEPNYEASVQRIARALGVWVVGGSHHHRKGSRIVNRGVVSGPDGSVVTDYEKLNPYGVEGTIGVERGSSPGFFEVGGRRVVVLICADLWHSGSFTDIGRPDLVLVPSFSVTQWPSTRPARILWRHMAAIGARRPSMKATGVVPRRVGPRRCRTLRRPSSNRYLVGGSLRTPSTSIALMTSGPIGDEEGF